MIEFYPPVSTGEWVQVIGAAITIFTGLLLLLLPGIFLRMTSGVIGNWSESVDWHAKIAVRAHLSGLYLGLGIAVLLLQQPLLYLTLGISWGFAAFSQIISMLLDRNYSISNFVLLIAKSSIAAVLILAVLGFFD